MKYLLTVILTLQIVYSYGQNFKYPVIINDSQKILGFVPNEWTILDSVSGDLNKDNFKDYVFVYQFKDSVKLITGDSDTLITQPRILGIFFWDCNENKYFLTEQSNSFILNHDNPYMDDPFNGINIEKNILTIGFRFWYSWGSWWTSESTHKFRYEKGEFTLIGFDSQSMHRASMETTIYSVNFLSKKYSITHEETIEEEIKSNTEWKTFKLDNFKTLRSLKKPFNWSFENMISI